MNHNIAGGSYFGAATLFLLVSCVCLNAINAEDKQQSKIAGKKVAILATDGFEQAELVEPRKALDDAGAKTFIVSLKKGKIKAWNEKNWGDEFKVDLTLDEAKPEEFDALLLPGGVMNPDTLRMTPRAVQFVKQIVDAGKPVAAICHGPWTLVEANVIRGKKLTSWPSLKTDIDNAGGHWVDSEMVCDHGLVTSRKPADIPAFNRGMIKEFSEGHSKTTNVEKPSKR